MLSLSRALFMRYAIYVFSFSMYFLHPDVYDLYYFSIMVSIALCTRIFVLVCRLGVVIGQGGSAVSMLLTPALDYIIFLHLPHPRLLSMCVECEGFVQCRYFLRQYHHHHNNNSGKNSNNHSNISCINYNNKPSRASGGVQPVGKTRKVHPSILFSSLPHSLHLSLLPSHRPSIHPVSSSSTPHLLLHFFLPPYQTNLTLTTSPPPFPLPPVITSSTTFISSSTTSTTSTSSSHLASSSTSTHSPALTLPPAGSFPTPVFHPPLPHLPLPSSPHHSLRRLPKFIIVCTYSRA